MDPSYNNTNSSQSSQDLPTAYHVMTWIVISIGLPLTLLAICALYSLVRDDHVAPVFVINLLVSDLIQICCLAIREATRHEVVGGFSIFIYLIGLIASVGFMVCVALERYLVVAFPMWYRFRRNIKASLMLSFLVWVLPFVLYFLFFFMKDFSAVFIVFAILLFLPLPVLIFFLAGTLKSLSAAISVPPEEKRRILGALLLVVLNYTLLFLPTIIWFLALRDTNMTNGIYDFRLCLIFVQFSPLVDLVLYVFMRKGAVDVLLACLCPCRLTREQEQISTTNDDTTERVSAV